MTEPDLSFNAADLSSTTINGTSAVPSLNTGSSDPLDVADFEDEAALINELLSASNDADDHFGPSDGGAFALPELDLKLTQLLGTLEHACQDTSAQVERAIEEVSRSVPRLTFDLQLMRENVVLLKFTLDSIRKRSVEATAHNETSQVMRRLKVLTTIKGRMEASRDVLREAEAWSSLESEVTQLVQEHEYVKAAERLAEANKSMVVFQNTPEYEARRSLMVSLQNGLEAGLSASLVAAINARDIDACKNYYSIFGQIQRETEFRNYYFGSRRGKLVKEWQAARLSDCTSGLSSSSQMDGTATPPQPVSFATYLPTFYSSFQTTINDERTYIPTIFPDPLETLSSFVQTTLESLSPSFPQRISDLSNAHGARFLLEVIRIYQATEEYSVTCERTFAKLSSTLAPPTPNSATPSTPTPSALANVSTPTASTPTAALTTTAKRNRRTSKAMSMSRRHSRGWTAFSQSHAGGVAQESEASEPLRAWETALFEPFLDWQAEYADLEARLLRSELARVTGGQDAMAFLLSSSSSTDGIDETSSGSSTKRKGPAKILLEQASAVFSLAEEALGRTMAFTHGYGAAGYVEAVDETFKSFFLKERDTLSRAKTSRPSSNSNGGPPESDGEVDEHGGISMEYSQSDWATFQVALRLLESCKTIWERIGVLEQKIRTRLVDTARSLRDAKFDPFNQIIPGTTRGALALLWQSSLNSSSLSSLLESIDTQKQNPPSTPLLPAARNASSDLTRASQVFLHQTILSPIMRALATYSSLSSWTQSSESRPDSRGAFDLHIPTFSLSPSETITRVGEGLLSLPGMFEVYGEDDALGFSIETLPALDVEILNTLRKEHGIGSSGTSQSLSAPVTAVTDRHSASPLASPHHQQVQSGGRHRSTFSLAGNEFLPSDNSGSPYAAPRISPTLSHHSSYSLNQPPSASTQPTAQGPSALPPLSADIVRFMWLSSLTRSVLLHLSNELLPSIRSLSKHGAEQLVSDLSYISNVAKALEVEVEEVEKWREALELDLEREGPAKKKKAEDAEEGETPEIVIEPNEFSDVVRRMRSGRPHLGVNTR